MIKKLDQLTPEDLDKLNAINPKLIKTTTEPFYNESMRNTEVNHIKQIGQFIKTSLGLTEPMQGKQTNYDQDTKGSCDLIFKSGMRLIPVSVRLRDFKYRKYNDITIRSRTQSGRNKTEFEKIRDGECISEYYIYGWLSEDQTHIIKWVMVNVEVLRMNLFIGTKTTNGDQSVFYKFDIRDLIVAGAVEGKGLFNNIKIK